MSHSVNCPNCKSPKVRMHNPEPLCGETYEGQPYLFDMQAYTQGICDDCLTVSSFVGSVDWGDKTEKRKVKVKFGIGKVLSHYMEDSDTPFENSVWDDFDGVQMMFFDTNEIADAFILGLQMSETDFLYYHKY